MGNRLKVGDITLREIIRMSEHAYKTTIDDKRKRYKIDIVSGRVSFRRGLTYDKSTKDWVQTGKEVRVDILVKSDPKSYKVTDDIIPHKYNITILFKDFLKKWDSPVRLRTGSNYKPRFPKKTVGSAGKISEAKDEKEKDKIRKAKEVISNQNKKIMEWNIKKGIQMQFFFQSQYVYKMNNLLFGPCYANRPPIIANPHNLIFLDKHTFFVCMKLLPRLFEHPSLRKMIENDERVV
jgi:hypothetical protein